MITRRAFLAAGAAVTVGSALTACSDDAPAPAKRDGLVTHVFGATEVGAEPQRIVCAGYTEHDYLLSLGIIPVAVTQWYGDMPFATWPWATDRLGSATPEVLTLSDGMMVDKIAALKPDLILATNAGLDRDTYDKLSAIAPTVAQTGRYAFFGPWKEQASVIGQAVFKSSQMDSVVQGVDDKFSAATAANPGLEGKKAVYLQGTLQDGHAFAYRAGPSTEFLSALKLTVPGEIDQYSAGGQVAPIPVDQLSAALVQADLLIWGTESDEQADALRADPAVAKLVSTQPERNIFTGGELTGAVNFSSPLSLPYVASTLTPELAAALR